MKKAFLLVLILATTCFTLQAQLQKKFEYLDVFQLEYTADPQISPDGNYVVYRRTGFDIMKDRAKGNLWLLSTDNRKIHHKLTSFEGNERQARWSPDGDTIAFVRSTDEGSEIFLYWTETAAT
ncbi:MAG: S9 family peptidase, partial [Flavobacterium sp.]